MFSHRGTELEWKGVVRYLQKNETRSAQFATTRFFPTSKELVAGIVARDSTGLVEACVPIATALCVERAVHSTCACSHSVRLRRPLRTRIATSTMRRCRSRTWSAASWLRARSLLHGDDRHKRSRMMSRTRWSSRPDKKRLGFALVVAVRRMDSSWRFQ